jgi:hypothetical protein
VSEIISETRRGMDAPMAGCESRLISTSSQRFPNRRGEATVGQIWLLKGLPTYHYRAATLYKKVELCVPLSDRGEGTHSQPPRRQGIGTRIVGNK